MDALVIAGGIPEPGEPLFAETRGQPKALLDIAGKPMVQWVLDALGQAHHVERVVLVGLTADSGVRCSKPTDFQPNFGGLLANIEGGVRRLLELNPQAEYVLAVSSDIPAITGPMIDWTVETTMQTRHDLYYCVIERDLMEKRFPGSRRSFVRLKDREVCGGDMNVFRTRLVTNRVFWEKIVAARKNAMKQAALVGVDVFLLLLARQLSLQRAERMISRRLKLRGRVVLCPYPEIGMDVDKPHQLEILRRDLEARVQLPS
ncbi:MAG: NTP transferase domain-containing protein [Chloroflexota bacterium]